MAESAMQASVAFDGSRLRNLQLLAGNAVIAKTPTQGGAVCLTVAQGEGEQAAVAR